MSERILLIVATRNRGKSKEIREFLHDFPVDIKDLNDFGPIPEAVEDGDTFEENAYKKASFTAKVLGYPALADDSGLEVEALAGAPGIHSARYAGPKASDAENNRKLLEGYRETPIGRHGSAASCPWRYLRDRLSLMRAPARG